MRVGIIQNRARSLKRLPGFFVGTAPWARKRAGARSPVTDMPRKRGNGPGWGGPAKGEGKKGAGHGQGRPEGVKNGEGKKARSAEACAPLVPDAVEVWRQIMMDATQPAAARVAAAEKVIHRAEGATPQKIEVRGEIDWSRLTDEELAAIAASGSGDAEAQETTH